MARTDAEKTPAAPVEEKPKTVWDSTLTSTPVVLTVVATLLAGLSSSEMTREYHRALAAQHQSKASDQWNFFQAKRIRGTTMETQVELIHAQFAPMPVTTEAIAENAARLPLDFERAARDAERLLNAVAVAKASLGPAAEKTLKEINHVAQSAHKKAEDARALQKQIDTALSRPDVVAALGYLNSTEWPKFDKEPLGDADIQEAATAIRARKTETETYSLMARVSESELRKALDAAESNARNFEEKTEPIDAGLRELAPLVQTAATLAGAFHRHADTLAVALMELPSGGSAPLADVRTAATALARADAALQKNAEELNTSFVAARRNYTARRYEREAVDNREIAGMYEVRVRKSSWSSERHRDRSILFFYGMLAAQAGVTIATLSLAVRQRSVLWSLATLAGFGAIFFSAYVYLYT